MSRISARRRPRRRDSRAAGRQAPAYLTRRIPCYDLLDEEALLGLEQQADWLLSEIGIEIRDDPVALDLFRNAGASVDGERLRFDPGLLRALCASAPSSYTMHARNPAHNIEFDPDERSFTISSCGVI